MQGDSTLDRQQSAIAGFGDALEASRITTGIGVVLLGQIAEDVVDRFTGQLRASR